MMLATITGVLTSLTLGLGLFGVIIRYALLPWLREQLVHPVQETHRQVTVNHHVSNEPTVLDRLDSLVMRVDALADKTEAHHLLVSSEHRRLWEAVQRLEKHEHQDAQQG